MPCVMPPSGAQARGTTLPTDLIEPSLPLAGCNCRQSRWGTSRGISKAATHKPANAATASVGCRNHREITRDGSECSAKQRLCGHERCPLKSDPSFPRLNWLGSVFMHVHSRAESAGSEGPTSSNHLCSRPQKITATRRLRCPRVEVDGARASCMKPVTSSRLTSAR